MSIQDSTSELEEDHAPYGHPNMRLMLRRVWGRLPEPLKLGRAYRETRRFLDQTEAWSRSQWDTYRVDRLRSILTYAGEHVPHYHDLFRTLGFDPREFAAPEDLARLPLVDKHQLRSTPDRFVAAGVGRMRTLCLATGGTTGVPHEFPYPRSLYNQECAFIHHLWARVGFVPGERLIILRGRPSSERTSYTFDPRWNARVFSVQHVNAQNVRDYREAMLRFGARFLLSYPSSAAWFLGLLADAGMEPPPFEALLLASENMPPPQRRFLEGYGSTRVFTWYGHTERLVLAGECESSESYHEEPAYGFVELVDDSGTVVTRPGEPGEIVGSTFDNLAFPFIRFRTGDRAAWQEQACVCGRPHRLLSHLQGRWGTEYLQARDGSRISVSTLNLHGDQYAHIRQFQYVQLIPGEAVLRIAPDRRYSDKDGRMLIESLSAVTGPNLNWSLEIVDRVVPAESGKHQLVARRGSPRTSEATVSA